MFAEAWIGKMKMGFGPLLIATPSIPHSQFFFAPFALLRSNYVLVKIIKIIFDFIFYLSMGIYGQSCKNLTVKKQMEQKIREAGTEGVYYCFLVSFCLFMLYKIHISLL